MSASESLGLGDEVGVDRAPLVEKEKGNREEMGAGDEGTMSAGEDVRVMSSKGSKLPTTGLV